MLGLFYTNTQQISNEYNELGEKNIRTPFRRAGRECEKAEKRTDFLLFY